VQLALADLLLDRGASLDPRCVRDALMNGCPDAAEYLARRGASVSLEDAAGIGRLDLVERHLEAARDLGDEGWRQLVGDALMMAIWYDRAEVVRVLLDRGFDPGWTVRGDGEGRTALHLASYEGRVGMVESLLRRGAPVNVADDRYGTTPLVWALHAWLAEGRRDDESYRAVVRLLAEGGAVVKPEWIDDQRLRADPALFDLLARRAGDRRP
jgi:ankyrin repeat protein